MPTHFDVNNQMWLANTHWEGRAFMGQPRLHSKGRDPSTFLFWVPLFMPTLFDLEQPHLAW